MMLIERIEGFIGKLSKRERILLVVAVFLVWIALMDLLVLGPILNHLSELDSQIHAKASSIRRDLRILSFKDTIWLEYAQYVRYMDSADKSEEEIVADLLRKIETIARQKNVSISNVQPGEVAENPLFRVYKTSLSGVGALMDVLEFMYLLEESDYLFRVTRYELTPKSKGSEVMKFSMDIERIFISKEDVPIEEILLEIYKRNPKLAHSKESPAVEKEETSTPLEKEKVSASMEEQGEVSLSPANESTSDLEENAEFHSEARE